MPTMVELESLVTYLTGDIADLRSKLKEAESLLQRTASVADGSSASIEGSLVRMGTRAVASLAPLIGVMGTVGAAFRGVKLAAEFEQTVASFTVLTGSTQKAQAALKELQNFALETPFQFPEILEAAKMMSAFGTEAENILPTMQLLGEVSAGLAIPLKELAYLYGTLQAQGRAFTIDIRQFAMRGIPIYLELAKVLGMVSDSAKKLPKEVMAELRKMIEKGDVDFDIVEKAFKKMTGPGGKFFGQLETQSQTLMGLFNNMREQIDLSLREIGQSIITGLDLKSILRDISEVSKQFNAWLKGMDPETRRFILFTSLAVVGVGGLLLALKLLTVVGAFAFSALLTPLGLLTTGLVGLTASVLIFGGSIKEAVTTVQSFFEVLSLGLGEAYRDITTSLFGLDSAITASTVGLQTWLDRNIEVVNKVALVTSVILGLIIAWKLLTLAVGIASAILAFFKVQQVASIALWLAWAAVVLIVKGVVWLWNASVIAATAIVATFTTLLSLSKIAMFLYTAGMLIAKAVIWLVNAALTVMNVLLAPVSLAVATVAAILFAAALSAVAAAALSVVAAIGAVPAVLGAVLDLLTTLPSKFGPVDALGKMFSEWGRNLRDVFHIMRSDSGLGWMALQESFRMAVAQIRDLWPPLWKFITDGAEIAGELISQVFKIKTMKIKLDIQAAVASGLPDFLTKEVREAKEQMDKDVPKMMETVQEIANKKFAQLSKNFEVIESPEVKMSRGKLAEIKAVAMTLDLLRSLPDAMFAGMVSTGIRTGAEAGEAAGQAFVHEFKKVEGTLFGGAEAISRMAEFRAGLPTSNDLMNKNQQVVIQTTPPPPNGAELQTVEVLKLILGVLQTPAEFRDNFMKRGADQFK